MGEDFSANAEAVDAQIKVLAGETFYARLK